MKLKIEEEIIKRWSGAENFLGSVEMDEQRLFYSRAIKFHLPNSIRDSSLRDIRPSDTEMLSLMIAEFNAQTATHMADNEDEDVRLERNTVMSLIIRRKRKIAKRLLNRYAATFIISMKRRLSSEMAITYGIPYSNEVVKAHRLRLKKLSLGINNSTIRTFTRQFILRYVHNIPANAIL